MSTFANLPDILRLQETYLNKQTIFSLTGYQVIRKDRSNGKKGGICLCVKNTISFSEIRLPECSNSIEIMGIKVSNVAIVNVYNPPSNSIDKRCLPLITKFPEVIICGDFNAHHKMWDSGNSNQNGVSLLAFIEENDYLLQNTSKPNHMVFNAGLKCSLINLTITSPSISHKCSLEVTNIFMGSDHCVIDTKININVSHSSQHLPRWAFDRANWDAFYHLCDLDNNHSLISADVHDFHNNLTSTIMDIANRTIPTTKPFDTVTVTWWSKASEIAISYKKTCF